jgi:uncharacterized protein (TIGR02996 family)
MAHTPGTEADRDGLLASIFERPDDDVPRLVYADWLDEHGQPERAEFIRLQVAVDRRPIGAATVDEAAVRVAALHDSYASAWSEELPGLEGLEAREFQRGLLFSVTSLTLERFRRYAEALRTRTAVRGVFFMQVGRRELPDCEELGMLTYLRPGHWWEGEAVPRCRHLAGLTHLSLFGCRLGDRFVTELASSPHFGRLSWLCLDGNNLTDEGLRALAAAPGLPCVEALDLGDYQMHDFSANRISPGGLSALADAAPWGRLRLLKLNHLGLDVDSARVLAESRHLGGLRHLDLSWNEELGDEGVACLVASPVLSSVEVLDLGHVDLVSAGARALAVSPHLRALRDLRLDGRSIDEEGLASLARAAWLGRLQGLSLDGPLPPAGLARFLRTADLGALTTLKLGHHEPGREVLAGALCDVALPSLRELQIDGSNLSDADLWRLARSPLSRHLVSLHLGNHSFSAAGLQAFLGRGDWPALLRLTLWSVPPEVEGPLRERWGPRFRG